MEDSTLNDATLYKIATSEFKVIVQS